MRSPSPSPSPSRCSDARQALRELGCVDVVDLTEVEEVELLKLGMKRNEVKRLLRHVQTES